MNGVRRFLGAATGAPPPSPDKDSPTQSSPTVPITTAPLSFGRNAQAPNWPPQASPDTSSPKQPTLGESIQSTAALFLGRGDKSRQTTAEAEVTVGSPYSATRPLNGSSFHSKSSSREHIPRHTPSPSRSTPRNGSLSGPSSPILQGRGITRKSVNKSNADVDVKRSSGFTNTRDELLFSLLASDAVVDSREFLVLTSEEVEELKKVRRADFS